jgi:hypothetical protein
MILAIAFAFRRVNMRCMAVYESRCENRRVLDFHVIIQLSIIKCTRPALYAHTCSTNMFTRVKAALLSRV